MGQVTTRSELDEALDRKPDGTPADNTTHWIDAKGNQKTYWPRVKAWAKWAGVPDKEQEAWVHNHLGVAQTREWLGTMDSAICTVVKAAMRKRTFDTLNRAMSKQDFIDATEYSNIEAALEKGESDTNIMTNYAEYLASDRHIDNAPKLPAATQAPETPTTSATEASAISLPETVARASSTPPSPENGQSTPVPLAPEIETKPSAIIPYQPKAVAHTLNVDWKITPLEMAQFAVQSKLYAGIDNPAKAMVVMMRGLELGVSPLTALEQVNIIQGKTVVSSALFLALIERSGQLENMVIDDSKPDACTITLTRRGRTPITATFTMDDARQMGLAGKDNWRKMPKTMLYHRALGIAGRRAFSDILLFGGGIYMPEEISPDTVVDENGDVIAA